MSEWCCHNVAHFPPLRFRYAFVSISFGVILCGNGDLKLLHWPGVVLVLWRLLSSLGDVPPLGRCPTCLTMGLSIQSIRRSWKGYKGLQFSIVFCKLLGFWCDASIIRSPLPDGLMLLNVCCSFQELLPCWPLFVALNNRWSLFCFILLRVRLLLLLLTLLFYSMCLSVL